MIELGFWIAFWLMVIPIGLIIFLAMLGSFFEGVGECISMFRGVHTVRLVSDEEYQRRQQTANRNTWAAVCMGAAVGIPLCYWLISRSIGGA